MLGEYAMSYQHFGQRRLPPPRSPKSDAPRDVDAQDAHEQNAHPDDQRNEVGEWRHERKV